MVDLEAVRVRWAHAGYGCDLWVDPPGQEWHDFIHDTDEMVCVLDGRLRIENQGRSVELGPGGEFHIPARTRHSVFNIGGTTARWLYGYRRV